MTASQRGHVECRRTLNQSACRSRGIHRPRPAIAIVPARAAAGAAAFLLVLMWTPPAEVAIKALLSDCYNRALLTRMHAEQSISAMFVSIDRCRAAVQLQIPKIHRNELKQMALDLLATLDATGSHNPANKAIQAVLDQGEINRLKLSAIRYFRQLAAATGNSYALPKEGSLAEATYFSEKDAQAPPSSEDLARQHQIESKTGAVAPTK